MRITSSKGSLRASAVALLAASVVLASCSGSSDDASSDSSSTTTTAAVVNAAPAGAVADGSAVPSKGCGSSTTGEVSMKETYVDDSDRWFLLTTPDGYDGTSPRPLVFDIHGLMEGAVVHSQMTEMSAFSQANGFILITPQGTGEPVHWEVDPDLETNPDLQYMEMVLDKVEAEQCVDTSRVYSTGLSNGAFMSSLLACTFPDRFAAVSPVAGVIRPSSCDPDRPVPMLAIHGTADPILLFNGGVGIRLNEIMTEGLAGVGENTEPPPAADLNGSGYPEAAQNWATGNGCTGDPQDVNLTETVIQRTWDCPADGVVEFLIIEDGGHTWPGSEFSANLERIMGATDMSIDGNEAIWAFFQRFQLPPA